MAGWPIAHHVWAGNEVDHTTVGKAIADLHRRYGFNRLVFVGDRGMVTSDNLDAITAGNHGYLVGLIQGLTPSDYERAPSGAS